MVTSPQNMAVKSYPRKPWFFTLVYLILQKNGQR